MTTLSPGSGAGARVASTPSVGVPAVFIASRNGLYLSPSAVIVRALDDARRTQRVAVVGPRRARRCACAALAAVCGPCCRGTRRPALRGGGGRPVRRRVRLVGAARGGRRD